MNKKYFSVSLASLMMTAAVMVPAASAFWPFDGLFDKGEVKSMTTNDGRIAKMPNDRLPVRSTAREIAALRAACKNIIDFDKPQQKKYENTVGKGKGDNSKTFEMKPLTKTVGEDTKIDHADQAFSAIYFLTSLQKDMGQTELESSVIDNYIGGMFEDNNEATTVLAQEMIAMLKRNGEEHSYLTKCLEKHMSG